MRLVAFVKNTFTVSILFTTLLSHNAISNLTLFNFRTSFEASQFWNLAVMFCRVHRQRNLSDHFLVDCAKAGKWLPFVCYAQAAQFPKHQVSSLGTQHSPPGM